MIKLLIADDEPLVCVGIQSMLNWEDYGIEVVGTARNGQQAADMIDELSPDIVITDIKMPIKTGLELAAEIREKNENLPVFIILTSYENFDFALKAMQSRAIDYLLKLELDAESLLKAIKKAVKVVNEVKNKNIPEDSIQKSTMQSLRDKFFVRLFNNLDSSDEQFLMQKEELGIDSSKAGYAVAYCEMIKANGSKESDFKVYTSAVQMAKETILRHSLCYVQSLDMRHFTIVFGLNEEQLSDPDFINSTLKHTMSLLYSYFSLSLKIAVGNVVSNFLKLGDSYRVAQSILFNMKEEKGISFKNDYEVSAKEEYNTTYNQLRKNIQKAFEEFDYSKLDSNITTLIELLRQRPDLHVQAMDIASNILYMAISLLPDKEKTIEEIFAGFADNYRSLYKMGTVDEIAEWLVCMRDGCCENLQCYRQDYKQQTVKDIQNYIKANINKHLSLNEVAALFNFNPSYLSRLFSQYTGEGFVEYITRERIVTAKEMLATGQGKVYEVAAKLGFENAFYFSKVFKKVEGISPREYIQKLTNEGISYLKEKE